MTQHSAPVPLVDTPATTPRRTDAPLSDRELLIAKQAAAIAVKDMMESFYKEVGRNIVNKFLIIIGAIAVGIAYGKGWINVK